MKLCTLLHFWFAFIICNASAKQTKETLRRGDTTNTVVCIIEEVDFEMEDYSEKEKRSCVFNENKSEMRYEIVGLDSSFWSAHSEIGSRTHSLTLLSSKIEKIPPIPGNSRGAILNVNANAIISVDILKGVVIETLSGPSIPEPGTTLVSSGSNRKLSKHMKRRKSIQRTLIEGTREVLVVRVSDQTGDQVQNSRSQIADDIFFDAHNLANRYRQCSNFKLDMVPASGPDIVDGVVDITIPFTISGEVASSVEFWVTDHITNTLGLSYFGTYAHIMYILPNSVNFEGAAAYAYLNSDLSIYREKFQSHLQVLVHEIGHNLNNRHSGTYDSTTGDELPYGDGTCMMGASIFSDDIPQMCFNAAKSYNFGWYADKHAVFSPFAQYFYGKLVGIDDYVNGQIPPGSTEYHVILKVGDNLYLMYNRKEGINSQVQAQPDMVTITTQATSDAIGEQSWNWGALDEGEEYRFPDAYGIGNDLVIKVCEKAFGEPDYATVLVYLEGYQYPNGEINPTCSQSSLWQSPPPTEAPSPHPTGTCEDYPPGWYDADGPRYNCEWYATSTHCESYGSHYARDGYTANQACCVCGGGINPTAPPNPSPTASPTPSPTSPPTHSPTALPTRSPTASPTRSPTLPPTPLPTASPTPSPTSPPSPSPTSPPTPSPTVSPSPSPTSPPSPSPTSPPSPSPTSPPTPSPTVSPSHFPTAPPSPSPTAPPTPSPTAPTTLESSSNSNSSSGPGAFGDPHIKLWNGEAYDFHGICDLVLLQNNGFGNGLGMHIHIRTKKIQQWSYISNAVLLIGDESFEVMGTARGSKYWINAVAGSKLHGNDMDLPEGISDFNIHYKRLHSQQTEYTVDLMGGEKIIFSTWKNMIRVSVVGATAENFESSLGLMGIYKNGLKMARDNLTIVDDLMKFGEEWQVLPSEPKLFHNIEGPQAPMRCDIPSKSATRRRLAAGSNSNNILEAAEQACANIIDKIERDACVFDVIATGDTGVAKMY